MFGSQTCRLFWFAGIIFGYKEIRVNYIGTEADDNFNGTSGNDTFDPGLGNDYMGGGDGVDTVDYRSVTGDLNINVGTGIVTGASGNDNLNLVENAYGGFGNDTFTGSSFFDNVLDGGAGNDTFMAADGGNDTFIGGEGIDTVSYAGVANSVNINLMAGTVSAFNYGSDGVSSGNDLISSVEKVIGGLHGDIFIASNAAEDMNGGGGLDTVSFVAAGAGVNVNLVTGLATGGSGNDVISSFENVIASDHNDTVVANATNNVIDGRMGVDTVSYFNQLDAISVDFVSGTVNGLQGQGTLTSVENVIATGFNDSFVSSSFNNVIDGGAGSDTVSYATSVASVEVNLAAGTSFGGGGMDTLLGVENVVGSIYNDTLQGNNFVNRIDGGAGNDTVSYSSAAGGVKVDLSTGSTTGNGAGGSDVLVSIENIIGSNLNDAITGTNGDNVMDGAGGADTVVYTKAASAVTIDLLDGYATGGGGNDGLISIENAIGSNFGDKLIGGAGNNILNGGAGIDMASYEFAASAVAVDMVNGTVSGGAGRDTLISIEGIKGSDFNDLIRSNVMPNFIDGGAGVDTVDYSAATASVVANLSMGKSFGASGNDTLIGIENVNMTNFNDEVVGDAASNRIFGRAGNDVLDGDLGDDFVYGEDGDDELYGWVGNDTLLGGAGLDKIYGEDGNDVVSGGDANDSISGGLGDDRLYGDNGDDTILGGDGIDKLYGGEGGDILSGGLGGDAIDGGAGRDVLRGDDGNDALNGGDDNDSIYGGLGNDLLVGGLGGDSLKGEAGKDILMGGAGGDVLSGGLDGDVFKYTAVTDSLASSADFIADFTAGWDKIDLSAIDAKADAVGGAMTNDTFTVVAKTALNTTNANGAVWFSNGFLYASVDTDVAAEFAINLNGVSSVGAAGLIL
jgi:Ca2+-binding RTX toxin-like protein